MSFGSHRRASRRRAGDRGRLGPSLRCPRISWGLGAAAIVATVLCGLAGAASVLAPGAARAEYADVILNRRSDRQGVRPVVFPHWFHRIRFQCRVCHSELGFEMRVGANDVTMDDITEGKFCGACHNGEIAWSTDNCDLCHSAIPGTPAGIRGGHETMGPGNW